MSSLSYDVESTPDRHLPLLVPSRIVPILSLLFVCKKSETQLTYLRRNL
jgi:hypothetical protein